MSQATLAPLPGKVNDNFGLPRQSPNHLANFIVPMCINVSFRRPRPFRPKAPVAGGEISPWSIGENRRKPLHRVPKSHHALGSDLYVAASASRCAHTTRQGGKAHVARSARARTQAQDHRAWKALPLLAEGRVWAGVPADTRPPARNGASGPPPPPPPTETPHPPPRG